MASTLPASMTIIFDGRCGMCTRTITWLVAHDPAGRLNPVPCQSRAGIGRYRLSREQCEDSVWVVSPAGERAAGGQAAVLIAAVLWQRPLVVALGRLPGVRHLLQAGYHLVARNRSWFPGMMPWCESHPDDCDSAGHLS